MLENQWEEKKGKESHYFQLFAFHLVEFLLGLRL